MNRIVWPLLALWVMSAVPAAHAAQVKGLYEASVPVESRSTEEQNQALRAALARVLIKVSGFGGIAEEPAVAPMLEDADKFVQQFRYESKKEEQEEEGRQFLWVQFDRGAINAAMREEKLPIWGEARPVTLAWVAVEEDHQRRLVGATDDGPVVEALKSGAEQRSLPIRLPFLDLQDQANVRVADVWGGFQGPVLEASQRYDTQAILMARLYSDGVVWRGAWTLYQGGDSMHWQTESPIKAEALRQGIGGAADHLSVRFAQVFEGGGVRELTIEVGDVRDLRGYTRLVKYLRSVGGVNEVAVTRVEPDKVSCRLTLEVDAENVAQTIALGSTLAPEESAGFGNDEAFGGARHYRLLR